MYASHNSQLNEVRERKERSELNLKNYAHNKVI